MKAIILPTPIPENGGMRRDAGEMVAIGGDRHKITLELAQALVDAGSAVESKSAARKVKPLPDAASDEAE